MTHPVEKAYDPNQLATQIHTTMTIAATTSAAGSAYRRARTGNTVDRRLLFAGFDADRLLGAGVTGCEIGAACAGAT